METICFTLKTMRTRIFFGKLKDSDKTKTLWCKYTKLRVSQKQLYRKAIMKMKHEIRYNNTSNIELVQLNTPVLSSAVCSPVSDLCLSHNALNFVV